MAEDVTFRDGVIEVPRLNQEWRIAIVARNITHVDINVEGYTIIWLVTDRTVMTTAPLAHVIEAIRKVLEK